MGPIRIDENSMDSSIKEVFEMQPGSVFGVAPEFFQNFIKIIPKDKFFKFTPISENSSDFSKYGSNCYRVLCNKKLICF